jgi:hypothetical protein
LIAGQKVARGGGGLEGGVAVKNLKLLEEKKVGAARNLLRGALPSFSEQLELGPMKLASFN